MRRGEGVTTILSHINVHSEEGVHAKKLHPLVPPPKVKPWNLHCIYIHTFGQIYRILVVYYVFKHVYLNQHISLVCLQVLDGFPEYHRLQSTNSQSRALNVQLGVISSTLSQIPISKNNLVQGGMKHHVIKQSN